ncbi:MAG: peroxiredoxin family protein, partial [Verrucomicrobiota bacterium]
TTWRKRLAVYEAVYTKTPVEAREKLDKARGLSALERARLYKHMANWEKAESLLKAEEEKKKNPLLVRANRIEVLNLLGQKDDVKKGMDALRPLAKAADLETPALKRLQPIVKKLKLPEDWRVEPEAPGDLIERPELTDLGPFRWAPVKARPWTLTDADGHEKSLADYEGKPVLVIFYLGKGCKHCLEQLTAFDPLYQAYTEAGIELVAISMDEPGGLKETFALSSEGGEEANNPFSFPLLSDASLKAFKAYRAYDEFENQPLHGTFLVDERGYVRWQDISFEPMMEPAWLLEESKRLLKLPGGAGAIASTGEEDVQS